MVIPTVLLVAFIAAFFVPQTWQWMLGAVVAIGIGWGIVIAFLPDASVAIVAGAALLGAVNATVGLGLGLLVRRLVIRRRRPADS
jgi:hypothetical protein